MVVLEYGRGFTYRIEREASRVRFWLTFGMARFGGLEFAVSLLCGGRIFRCVSSGSRLGGAGLGL
jgi:hypothetical protein